MLHLKLQAWKEAGKEVLFKGIITAANGRR